ncbi:elongation factor EF-1 gamma subunit [Maublancomyces gigas]|uniref:Elongation factor EF-1 gamma subunit n=1 Tax=Discina gigas TaxID=1032678 RepID=A0ABR3G7R9_9PEZI
MPFGKIYTYPNNPRTTVLLAVAKANGLELEIVAEEPSKGVSPEYLKINPLGKVPTFQGEDGFILSECIAIAIYLAAQNEKTTLLGKTKQDYAQILRWMSFANSELLSSLGGWFLPLIGREPYNKKNVDIAQAKSYKTLAVLEKHLLNQTYLVGERLTLADLFATSVITRGFTFVLGKEFRETHPNVTRWYTLIYSLPIYADVASEFAFIDEPVQYTPPKKEAKKQEPKKEAAPKAAAKPADDDDDDEDKPVPKPKHPLEALGKPTLALDDWKKKYSNEDTRSVALPWFWETVKPEEYSLWRVDYKYNDELTQVFMSSNLVGGFFNRLEASRKYLFGSASVYGEHNDSVVTGAFLLRGQEHLPVFDVAPDYESYSFTRLDPANPADREFVNDMWAWDKPVTIGGKTYNFADGKVFK